MAPRPYRFTAYLTLSKKTHKNKNGNLNLKRIKKLYFYIINYSKTCGLTGQVFYFYFLFFTYLPQEKGKKKKNFFQNFFSFFFGQFGAAAGLSVKAYFEESGARPFTCKADGAGQVSFVLLSFVLLCPPWYISSWEVLVQDQRW